VLEPSGPPSHRCNPHGYFEDMRQDAMEGTTGVRWPSGDEPSARFELRSDRDERAIRLVCDLLMAGVALERQVNALIRARRRS
jgi:hypothetical protein